jgi:hypothetical protein
VTCTGTAGTSGYACTPTDSTIIQDSVTSNTSPLIITTGGTSTHFTMSGFTFKGGSTTFVKFNGFLAIGGNSQNIRLTQLHIDNSTYSPAGLQSTWLRFNGPTQGVIDHTNMNLCTASACIGVSTNGFQAFNTIGDSIGNGDGTWQNATPWGTLKAIYLESSDISGGYPNDCDAAGFFVERYNIFRNVSVTAQTHATVTAGGSLRGCRGYEEYHNYATQSTGTFAFSGSKGGPALVWGNTAASGSFNWVYGACSDRQCDTRAETNNSLGWGYCGANAINPGTGLANGVGSGWDFSFSGNGYPCLDGVGRGQTQDTMNGANLNATPSLGRLNVTAGNIIAWPHQMLEPVYLIHNTITGAGGSYNNQDISSTNNRDYYEDCNALNSTCTGSFTGAFGTGFGALGSRPATCTAGPGGTTGVSPTGSYGVGYQDTATEQIYACSSTNTWTGLYSGGGPLTYPHPLVGGTTFTLSTATAGTGSGTVTCSPTGSGISSGTPFSCAIAPAGGSTIASVTGCGGTGTTTYTGTVTANCTVTATFQGTVVAPTLSPVAGSYGPTQNVTISTSTGGATIRYTTDGSTPTTTHGTVYSTPVSVATSLTIKAIAYETGWNDSSISSAAYVINGAVNAPVFGPIADTYAAGLPVVMLTTTAGATIRYTTSGTAPTCSTGTVYTAGVSIGSTTTLKAIACETGYSDSSVTSGVYTISGTPSILFTATLSSNSNSSGIVVTPSRKQLGNVGTGCDGSHNITPLGVPVGQLYATSAIRTAAIAAGCATQNAVTVTSSGVGIQAMDNGNNSGGTDSPVTVTDTYGGTADDAVCSGDPSNSTATPITGLSPLGCVANGSAVFAQSTAGGHGNSDVLWPSQYTSNSTTLDNALAYYRDMYWCADNVSTLHDWEFDVNINSSPTAYSGGTGAYAGWGFDWGGTSGMFRAAPQSNPWTVLLGVDVAGGANITSYPLTSGHCYKTRNFGHRRASCTASSGSNCMFYDYLQIWDVTAATSPKTYALFDSVAVVPMGGIPVNLSSWASGPDMQVQIDMTAAAASTQVRVISDTTEFYGSAPATSYTWTATATNGSLTGSNCANGSYVSGNTIGACTAVPNTGYSFTSWSSVSGSAACSGATNPCPSFSIGANSAATANFTINSWTLSTATAGSGTGTITGCAGAHNYNASYSCTVTATGGSTLASVTGCSGSGTTTYTGNMPNAACTVTATFNAAAPTANITIAGTVKFSGGIKIQ